MRHFAERRRRLSELLGGRPVLLLNGHPPARNSPANRYPFRCSSHFLYFCGPMPPGSAALLREGECLLFLEPVSPEEVLWTGGGPDWEALGRACSASEVLPFGELESWLEGDEMSLPTQDPLANAELERLLGRLPDFREGSPDRDLALAVVELRLRHDEAALRELKAAAEVTAAAHRAGMAAARPGGDERLVRAAMEAVLTSAGMVPSFSPIVTVRGEVLHQPHCGGRLRRGDLLLVDLGAETPAGFAGDVTRTVPVGGKFSPSQRAAYELVLEAHRQAASRLRPGVRFRDVHLEACRVLAAGLVEEGLLRGAAETLVERGAHALFFPHGLGHLVGLDVHDMEDLGDLAGYPPGATRDPQFGLNHLRLDRLLQPGMVVTIEPGFYRIPRLLEATGFREAFRDCLGDLSRWSDVRGIRIEDEYRITQTGAEQLTAGLPREAGEVEAAAGGG